MRSKSSIIICCCVLFMSFNGISQENHFSLHYDEFEIFLTPKKCVDTLYIDLKGKYQGCKLKLYLSDCRGESCFELYGKKNDLKTSGRYSNAIDTLKKYRIKKYLGESENIEKYSISTISYLYPLRAGEWLYYEGSGKQRKKRKVTYVYSID